MKHFYILILGCLFFGVHLGHAQINLNTCDEYTGDLDFVLTFESVDGSGRNIYQTNPINGDQPCPGLGVCEFRIAWNVTLNRWEVLAEDGDGDFATSFVLYSNTSASSPNPPDLTLGTWQENTALTGGECMALQELSGDVQSTLNSNTAPIATAPSAPFVIEDGINVALPDDIQVFDPDGDNQTLTFTITGGTLALGSTGINFGGSGNGSSNFTALGNLTNINNALDVATFTPTPNLSGVNTASISFVSNDGITNSNTASVTFDIEPINDAPIFNGNRVISYTENGSPTKFNSGGNIILSEPEGDDIIEATITFNDQISGDILSVETPSPYSVSQSGNEIKLQGTGSVAQMITALESIEYSFNGNDPTSGETDNSRNISIVVKEASGLSSNSMTVQVSINALNDDPTFTGLPSTISVLEDVASVIDLSAATFGDVDSDSGSVTLSLSVSAGTLTAISGSGVTVSFPITGTMNLNGTAAAIENYLNTPSNINYTNESGSNTATLSISANDNGNSGSGGGTLISFGTININVNSIPSVTSVIVPANRTYLANQNLDFTINFSEAVDVNTTIGTPELNIVIGANTKSAVYVSGSGSSALVFRYVVASGDYDTDGISITGLNTSGGTIRNPSGSDANLMLNNVGNTTNILVNGCDLTASGVATAVSCNGGSDASIDLAVVGGTASYTYLWSNGATTEDLSGLTAGTYDVTVTDANGCTATASIQVNEPTILSASGVATAVSCNGGSDASIDLAVVGGTASYTYLWSNGATTEDLSGLTAGTYDVTVTDANGCTATASIQVNEPTILSASGVATAVSCNGGSDASIDLAVVGGTASYTYLWSNGATTEDLSGLTAGTYDVTVTDANGCTATASIQVNEPTILSASGVATAVSCNGGSDASIDLAVVGGTASYTYLWSNGATTEDLSGLTAGTYDVTVTDANGCTATASIQVNEPTILSASGVATAVSCNGGSDASIDLAVVGGTASYTYLWSNGATTEDLSGLTAGTYDVTVTDANGCTATASIQVNEPTILSASGVATAVSCNGGSDASIDLAVVGGTASYTYLWSNGATTEDLSGLTAGTYDVTVTDANGCTATASIQVNEPTILSASGVATAVSCNGGSDASIDLAVVGGTASYTYLWSNGATTEDLSGLTAGTYDVTVTDANGCTATASIQVNEPTILSASGVATAVSCNGGSDASIDLAVVGGTASYTYLWSNGATTEDLSGLTAGTYDVTVTDANGCTATASIQVNEPTILSASGVATAVSCNGGSDASIDLAVVGGTASYTYLWSNGATTEDLSGLTAGTYDVTVTDANGCTATASIQVNEPTILSASGVATAVSCNGGSDASIDLAVVGGTASYTYLWSNGATTEDLSGLTAGTYDVTVTDANGCTATASIQVNEPTILTASGVATAVSCNGGSDASIDLAVVGGTASYTYLWSNGATTEDLSGLTAGTYDVTVTDANGCTATASIQVNEPTILTASGVATAVSCNGGSNASIDLAVVGGTASYTYLWSNGATTEDLSGLTAGTYDVTVTDANGCTATASIQVNEPTILSASGVATAVSCNGGSDASIDLAVVGGTASYTYLWSNGATTEDLSGLTAGTYDVTVTDANGCTATASFVIEVIDSSSPLALTRDISVNLDANGSALITAGDIDNGSYDNCSIASLEIDQTEFSCSTLGENTVTLTVTDTNGNVSTATAVVTVTGCAQQGITFEDESFTYDGTVHALAVNNLPTDATVRYTNNEKIDAGVYTVEAVVTRPYYLDLILTASLSIEQASQIISFDELPMVSLETDPDFQLQVTASSGLPVSYSYTYSSTVPAAMVSESGFVSLVQSGTITITATQAGNENYQPATPVSQEFIVTSADASITRLTIGDSEYLNPDAIITYVIDCGEDVQTLYVTYETEANATGNMPKTFSVPVPQPGIYRTTLVVSSQDGMVSRTYTIEIHKRFLFGEIVVQKFNNTLVVNNNSQTNGGYRFTGYQWYKNGRLIGNEQYFSEGDLSTDMLDPFASYRVELITAGGDVLSTCAFNIELQASGKIHLAPNPVRATSSATLFAEFDREELKDMKISIHSLQGTLVDTFYTSGSSTTVQMPAGIQAGVYVLVCETKKQTQTIQFIVN